MWKDPILLEKGSGKVFIYKYIYVPMFVAKLSTNILPLPLHLMDNEPPPPYIADMIQMYVFFTGILNTVRIYEISVMVNKEKRFIFYVCRTVPLNSLFFKDICGSKEKKKTIYGANIIFFINVI